eukprot:gnl/TRDRNA2_/TRDRNA2_164912_c0_seq2.p1 gnl/TRDRNA2_/TRDRNA2_164912_c0~~gnl/TRDRNA2_/TRDRNA2_164912_c0_seq2.p1  ORF type:complete len:384 (+),score=53.64 gnl/TRDRNA2_/TRDRNA2_164912_c0_seq2:342-1493(+)
MLLSSLSFGRSLGIVRRCLKLGLLGRNKGLIVLHTQSEECEKRMNAESLKPTNVGIGERYVSSWEPLQSCLGWLLHVNGGSLKVSCIKMEFRKEFRAELSETAFGHLTLMSLLGDERLCGPFELQSKASGMEWMLCSVSRACWKKPTSGSFDYVTADSSLRSPRSCSSSPVVVSQVAASEKPSVSAPELQAACRQATLSASVASAVPPDALSRHGGSTRRHVPTCHVNWASAELKRGTRNPIATCSKVPAAELTQPPATTFVNSGKQRPPEVSVCADSSPSPLSFAVECSHFAAPKNAAVYMHDSSGSLRRVATLEQSNNSDDHVSKCHRSEATSLGMMPTALPEWVRVSRTFIDVPGAVEDVSDVSPTSSRSRSAPCGRLTL